MADYCELLDGTCGEEAVATVQDVRCCAEHAKALRAIARPRCVDCGKRPAGTKSPRCPVCRESHARALHNAREQRRRDRWQALGRSVPRQHKARAA